MKSLLQRPDFTFNAPVVFVVADYHSDNGYLLRLRIISPIIGPHFAELSFSPIVVVPTTRSPVHSGTFHRQNMKQL